jgi:hypothetical protein
VLHISGEGDGTAKTERPQAQEVQEEIPQTAGLEAKASLHIGIELDRLLSH